MDTESKLLKAGRVSVFLAVLVVLVGCEKGTPQQEAVQPGVASGPKVDSFKISEISVNESEPGASTQTKPDSPVIVAVRSSGVAVGKALEVKIFDLGGGVVVASEERSLHAGSGNEQVFTFNRKEPWAPGRYLVEVTVDGELAGHRELDVMEIGAATPDP